MIVRFGTLGLLLPVTFSHVLLPLTDPVCANGDVSLQFYYLGDYPLLVRLLGWDIIGRTINQICLGHGDELPDAQCTCDKSSYRTTCLGAEEWTPDQRQMIVERLCQKVCHCNPLVYNDFSADEDDLNSLDAASDTGLMYGSMRKSFPFRTLQDVGKFLKGKCKWRCTGPRNCIERQKSCAHIATVCRVQETANGIFSSSGLCVPPTMSISRASAYKGLVPREDSEKTAVVFESCACNRTYVSHACCESSDGFVWEERQAKLGEMMEAEI